MKYYDVFFAFVVIPICVVVGSWFFEASFAITFSVIIFGVVFGTIIDWKKSILSKETDLNNNFLHPKNELLIYCVVFILTLLIIYKFFSIYIDEVISEKFSFTPFVN